MTALKVEESSDGIEKSMDVPEPLSGKSEESSDEEAITVAKVAERLRFFFSDANIRIDKFLRREIFTSKDGFVRIEVLLRFNSIKDHTDCTKIVAKAVKHELCSSSLTLSNDGTSIARVVPFTEDMMNDNVKVTLRVSDIPRKDDTIYAVTRDELKTLFTEFGNVALVRMLHRRNGHDQGGGQAATGKALVEFESEGDFQKAASLLTVGSSDEDNGKELEPQRVLRILDTPLRVTTMKQWLDKKKFKTVDNGSKKNKRENSKRPLEEGNAKCLNENQPESTKEKQSFTLDWEKGCVVAVKGLPEGCDREKIMSAISGCIGTDIKFRADYSRGLKDGYIRFEKPNEKVVEVAEKLSNDELKIDDSTVGEATVLSGEEEEEYYKNYISFLKKQQQMRVDTRKSKRHRGNHYNKRR